MLCIVYLEDELNARHLFMHHFQLILSWNCFWSNNVGEVLLRKRFLWVKFRVMKGEVLCHRDISLVRHWKTKNDHKKDKIVTLCRVIFSSGLGKNEQIVHIACTAFAFWGDHNFYDMKVFTISCITLWIERSIFLLCRRIPGSPMHSL